MPHPIRKKKKEKLDGASSMCLERKTTKMKPEGAAMSIPHIAVYRFHSFYMCSFITFSLLYIASNKLPPLWAFFFLFCCCCILCLLCFKDQNNLHALSICLSRFTIKERWPQVCLFFFSTFFHTPETLHCRLAPQFTIFIVRDTQTA